MSSAVPEKNRIIFRPVDIATLIYIFVQIVLISVFMFGDKIWIYLVIFYLAAAGIVVLVGIYPIPRTGRFWRAFRVSYPMILFPFFYKAVGPQILMIHETPFDRIVHSLEVRVFGIDPALGMLRYIEIWINEVMSFSYLLFYFFLPITTIIFIYRNKWISLERIILTSSVTFYSCYLIFILYPVMGPRFFLNDIYYLPIIGPFFTPLVQGIVGAGGLLGGAMPSSHCALALVVVWAFGLEFRKARLPGAILLLLLCFSTVYGRFHYFTDVLIGLAIGAICILVANRWHERSILRSRVSEFSRASAEFEFPNPDMANNRRL